ALLHSGFLLLFVCVAGWSAHEFYHSLVLQCGGNMRCYRYSSLSVLLCSPFVVSFLFSFCLFCVFVALFVLFSPCSFICLSLAHYFFLSFYFVCLLSYSHFI